VRFSRRTSFAGIRSYPFLWVFVYAAVLCMGAVFLVCGVALQPVLSTTLPTVWAQVPEAGTWQTVFLAGDGALTLNRQEVALTALSAAIRQIEPQQRNVLFVVEPGVAFREVARVWRLCRQAGVRQVYIATLTEAP